MKIIHTADMHLGSPLRSKLPALKVRERARELTDTFRKIAENATREGASAVIIAGDLFDSERVAARIYDEVVRIIEATPISFFYLPGNHEGDSFISQDRSLPKNLYTFGEEWTYYDIGDLTVAGRSICSADMFNTYAPSVERKNIVVLHGELRDRSDAPDIIGKRDAVGRGIDYIALGHYHGYSSEELDRRCTAVYSGAPEGRGFDECGDHGYVVIDTSGSRVTHRFVPSAVRRLHILRLDTSGVESEGELCSLASELLSGISERDMVRLELVGKHGIELICDTDSLNRRFAHGYYYFEVKDSSGIEIRAEDYINDKSLKGEFIRQVMQDETLSDNDRSRVIACGLYALSGEALYDR